MRLQGAGELRIVAGMLWLTRCGDTSDQFLPAGRRWPVAAGDGTVIEAAFAAQACVIEWRPDAPLLSQLMHLLGSFRVPA